MRLEPNPTAAKKPNAKAPSKESPPGAKVPAAKPAAPAPPPPSTQPATVTQIPAATGPRPAGVAQRAAGGLLRSKAFLERQAVRFGRWSDTPHGLRAAEATRDAITELKEAIDALMRIPRDYQPPSTPNALGVGARVALKARELERMADVFEGVEDPTMEVVAVYAGGRLRVRLANGDKMVLHRAQVNPVNVGDDDGGSDE